MLKAYAIGFFGAVLALGLATAIWLATQPEQKPSLVWGTTTYTSKEQFKGYLKSKGLSYKTWLARNPGAAPWEPVPRTQVKGADHTEDDGRTTRQVVEDWATDLPLTPLVAILAGGATLILVRRRSQPSSETASMEQPEVAPPAHVPRSGQVVIRTARAYVKRVPTFLRERNIGASDVAFGLLGFATLGFFMLFVALLASA
jgi:hypothetical protein